MIDPTALRVVGQLDENKGLDRVPRRQYATLHGGRLRLEEI